MLPPMLQSRMRGWHLLTAALLILLVLIGLWRFWLVGSAVPTAQVAPGAQPLRHSQNGNFKVLKP